MIVHFVGFGRMYDHHCLNFHKSNFLHEIVDIIRQFMSLIYILMDMITVLDIFAFFQTNENHIQLNEKKNSRQQQQNISFYGAKDVSSIFPLCRIQSIRKILKNGPILVFMKRFMLFLCLNSISNPTIFCTHIEKKYISAYRHQHIYFLKKIMCT
jgi:hypothetical protein